MRGSRARLVTLTVWAVFAFVTWNVVFDRQVYLAAVEFTAQQVERYQRGEAVASIDAAFSPRVGRAAWQASAWGGAVLAVGAALAALVGRDRSSR
jgi:hypothetical protein